jgi:protein transport protein SEC31
MTYYANQNTGESSWDPPMPDAPLPEPISMNGNSKFNGNASSLKTQKVANKYGDGFVTSASNPKLAEQYGIIGTSNPYSDAN